MFKFVLILLSFWGINIVLLTDLLTDFRLIEFKKKSPDHTRGLLIRGLFILVASTPMYFSKNFEIIFFFLLDMCMYYWAVFDPFLNVLRDKGFFYQGISSDPEEDSWFDQTFEQVNPKQLFIYKIICFCILTLLLILTCQHWSLS